jgi:hypothetical protein
MKTENVNRPLPHNEERSTQECMNLQPTFTSSQITCRLVDL